MKSLFYWSYLSTKQMVSTHEWLDKWWGSLMDGYVAWQWLGSQTDVLVSAQTLGQKHGIINGWKMEGGRIDWWMDKYINRWMVSWRAARLGRWWRMFSVCFSSCVRVGEWVFCFCVWVMTYSFECECICVCLHEHTNKHCLFAHTHQTTWHIYWSDACWCVYLVLNLDRLLAAISPFC